MSPSSYRVAARIIAEQMKSAPKKVDDLFKEVKDGNPSYSDAQAWATAWSIYCKHVDPNGSHCKKSPSEYLKEAVSKDDAEEMAEFKKMVHEMTAEMLSFAEDMERFKGKMSRWLDKLPKNVLWKEVPNDLEGAVSSMDKAVGKLRGHAHKLGT